MKELIESGNLSIAIIILLVIMFCLYCELANWLNDKKRKKKFDEEMRRAFGDKYNPKKK